MKKIITLSIALLTVFLVKAQDMHLEGNYTGGDDDEVRTLFGPDAGNGGYGALSFGYTQVEGRHALLAGGRGAWIIGRGLGLGIGGFGFINEPEFDAGTNLYYNLSGGYGGVLVEPIVMGKWPVHISLPLLAGAGAVARTSFSDMLMVQGEPYDAYLEEATLFLVAEPGVELEFNLLRWMRLSLFGSYRFTTNLNMIDVRPNALVGWNAGMTIKVGVF